MTPGGADRLAYVEEPGQPGRELLYDPDGNLVEIREAGFPVLTATHETSGRPAVPHMRSVTPDADQAERYIPAGPRRHQ